MRIRLISLIYKLLLKKLQELYALCLNFCVGIEKIRGDIGRFGFLSPLLRFQEEAF